MGHQAKQKYEKKVLCSAEKSSVIWAEPHSRSSAKQMGQTERSVGHYLKPASWFGLFCRFLQQDDSNTHFKPNWLWMTLDPMLSTMPKCGQKLHYSRVERIFFRETDACIQQLRTYHPPHPQLWFHIACILNFWFFFQNFHICCVRIKFIFDSI